MGEQGSFLRHSGSLVHCVGSAPGAHARRHARAVCGGGRTAASASALALPARRGRAPRRIPTHASFRPGCLPGGAEGVVGRPPASGRWETLHITLNIMLGDGRRESCLSQPRLQHYLYHNIFTTEVIIHRNLSLSTYLLHNHRYG